MIEGMVATGRKEREYGKEGQLTLSGLSSQIMVRPGGGGNIGPPRICLMLTQLGLS